MVTTIFEILYPAKWLELFPYEEASVESCFAPRLLPNIFYYCVSGSCRSLDRIM